MAFLAGLNNYLAENDGGSLFEEAAGRTELYCLHLHGSETLKAKITANTAYDIVATAPDGKKHELQKLQIKMLHLEKDSDEIHNQLRLDESVQPQAHAPIVSARQRHHIKNKNLFVLLREQEPVTVTLLEGEILQGTVQSFSRYEITLELQGLKQATILRHALLDIRDAQERCFLKSAQQSLRDWTQSKLYVDPRPRSQLRPGLKKSKIKRRQKIIIR